VAQGTPWALTLESNGTELRISQEKAETTISGTPLSLLALMREQPQTLIQRGDLRIEGDTDTAQQFGELALLLRPDLEHALSSVLGRSGAHVLMQGLRGTAAWTRETAWTAVQNLWPTSAGIWCRAPRPSIFCAASMRCASSSIASRRA
jgi:ubiquinone biosynthesis protein UbiJ